MRSAGIETCARSLGCREAFAVGAASAVVAGATVVAFARAVPPLGPCNALIGLDAVNPRDGRKRVSVRLLAARYLPLRAVEPPSTPPVAPAPARSGAASPAGTGP